MLKPDGTWSFEPVIFNEYQLPPVIYIRTCPIYWVLDQAKNKNHRKYLAAQIILGQPFAFNVK